VYDEPARTASAIRRRSRESVFRSDADSDATAGANAICAFAFSRRRRVRARLHPVFLAAAGVSVLAFALTWLVRELPLRTEPRASDAVSPPRDAGSVAEAA
jgi:hypothetical protein